VVIPAAIGAAISRARALGAVASALNGGSSERGGRRTRSCCLTSCFGCGACSLLAGILVLSIGSAMVAATAGLIGVGTTSLCTSHASQPCSALTGLVVGAPMKCPKLYVSQGYGNTPWEHPHTGIDIVCPPDTLVIAVAAGVFHRAHGSPVACLYPSGRTGGLGTYGVLDAGGTTFLYGHLDAYIATDGADVTIGQPLGFEGDSGCATGDHLHFEVLEGGRPVDPCPELPAGYPDPHDPTGLRCWGSAPP
jgi:murein DD-endopeptidase MepM/ murein hydrolase activator NlpD